MKSGQKNKHQAKKLGLWVKGLFALGIILIVAMLVGHFSGILQPESLWHNLLILGIALAHAAAALLHHYAEKMAFDEQAKQYERMTALFSKASEELEKILIRQQQQSNESAMNETDQKAAKTILLELGKEALEENGDWVLLHRKRPLELPKNG